jgi:hypothetical protein
MNLVVLRRAVQVSSRNDRPASEIREKDISDLSLGFKRSHDWDPQKARFHKDSRTVEEEISQDEHKRLDGTGAALALLAETRRDARSIQSTADQDTQRDGLGAAFTALLAETRWKAQHSD